jgi:superfamily I DNA/RNA helicase
MVGYPSQNRIPKTLSSLYTHAAPPLTGVVHRWRFANATTEAVSIANSCQSLIDGGVNPRDILILLSNQRELLGAIKNSLTAANVPFEPPRAETFIDSDTGRFVLAIVRLVCDIHDHVAHRLILGLRPGVGIGTCHEIANAVINNDLSYWDVFHAPLPQGIFQGRRLAALNHARQLCALLGEWHRDDTLQARLEDIALILSSTFGAAEAQKWRGYAGALPPDLMLLELRDWLWADTDEQQLTVLQAVYTRLNQQLPPGAALPPRVRIMSMHGAKGLSSRIVFIPGLEEHIFPGPWRQPYPGLVLEAARLLYVSITRARAACILSYSSSRLFRGRLCVTAPSRFTTSLTVSWSGWTVYKRHKSRWVDLYNVPTSPDGPESPFTEFLLLPGEVVYYWTDSPGLAILSRKDRNDPDAIYYLHRANLTFNFHDEMQYRAIDGWHSGCWSDMTLTFIYNGAYPFWKANITNP